MKLLRLHSLNNPDELVFIDSDDFSAAQALPTGSAVKLKDTDTPVLVHESAEEISRLLQVL